ncbi:MAG: hypothetical protein IPI04_15895 [Ignavibacteria bacterium]|nr:hypothetical protein [Ignavibacteria bacterium]
MYLYLRPLGHTPSASVREFTTDPLVEVCTLNLLTPFVIENIQDDSPPSSVPGIDAVFVILYKKAMTEYQFLHFSANTTAGGLRVPVMLSYKEITFFGVAFDIP